MESDTYVVCGGVFFPFWVKNTCLVPQKGLASLIFRLIIISMKPKSGEFDSQSFKKIETMSINLPGTSLSAFTRYCKRENNNYDQSDDQHQQLPRDKSAKAIIGNQISREMGSNSSKNEMFFSPSLSTSNLRHIFDAQATSLALLTTASTTTEIPTTSTLARNFLPASQQIGPMDQLSSLKKLIEASAFQKTETQKVPIFPAMSLMHPALINHPAPVSVAALGSAASNTCAKCGITFRMTSDLVYRNYLNLKLMY